MCLLLYLGSTIEVPFVRNDDISVEPVEEDRQVVTTHFTQPHVRYIGAPGCSCTFPHVEAEEPIEWFEGFFDESDDREVVLASVRALLELVGHLLATSPEVELYPVWDGDEAKEPKGVIRTSLQALEPEKFFLNERFFYRISSHEVPAV